MKAKKDFYFFIGTTAELIKLSPVVREMKKRKVNFKIIASNQNELRFGELVSILGKHKADYIFLMKPFPWVKDVYLRFLVWIVKSVTNYFLYFINEFKGKDKKTIYFIVHGDTVTALIGAVVAKLCRVELVHIESGLRSHNFLEPFPEELNRFVVSWLADVHFCPNSWAIKNLRGHKGIKINTFHNTIGETTQLAVKVKHIRNSGLEKDQKYFVFVLHRQEHTLFNKRDTERLIRHLTNYATPKLKCVFVMHHLTRDYLTKNKKLFAKIKKNPDVIMPERLDYISFVHLVKNSEFIATDGGSNQEEAYYMGLPCLILRNHTERIEGLKNNAVLSKNNFNTIDKFIKNYKKYERKKHAIKKRPAKIIVDYLLKNINIQS